MDLENELKTLTETSIIFEQQVPDFRHIKLARRELKMLKCIWDYIFIIGTSLDEWKTTMWKKIDVEGMDQECKKLTKELRCKISEKNFQEAFFYIHYSSFPFALQCWIRTYELGNCTL